MLGVNHSIHHQFCILRCQFARLPFHNFLPFAGSVSFSKCFSFFDAAAAAAAATAAAAMPQAVDVMRPSIWMIYSPHLCVFKSLTAAFTCNERTSILHFVQVSFKCKMIFEEKKNRNCQIFSHAPRTHFLFTRKQNPSIESNGIK